MEVWDYCYSCFVWESLLIHTITNTLQHHGRYTSHQRVWHSFGTHVAKCSWFFQSLFHDLLRKQFDNVCLLVSTNEISLWKYVCAWTYVRVSPMWDSRRAIVLCCFLAGGPCAVPGVGLIQTSIFKKKSDEKLRLYIRQAQKMHYVNSGTPGIEPHFLGSVCRTLPRCRLFCIRLASRVFL